MQVIINAFVMISNTSLQVAGFARPCAVTRVLEDVPEYAGTAGYDHESLARDSFGVSFGGMVLFFFSVGNIFTSIILAGVDTVSRFSMFIKNS